MKRRSTEKPRRDERVAEEQPERVLDAMGLEAGDVECEATGGEALGDFGELRADEFGVEHVRVSIHRRNG